MGSCFCFHPHVSYSLLSNYAKIEIPTNLFPMLGPRRTSFRRTDFFALAFWVLIFCFFGFLFHVEPALAQATPFEQFGQASKLPQTDLISVIARLIRTFLSILGIIFLILVLYAGYLYMTSAGDPAKTGKAKKLIQQAVVGFIIIMSSYAIVTFVINMLLKATGGQIVSQPAIEKYVEPLAGSLGAGIIENHYPPRDAQDIPRNTKIFITFKESIDPSTIIQGYDKTLGPQDPNQAKTLHAENVWIFETAKDKGQKLASSAVKVVTDEEFKNFVFDPVELLGNPSTDTNYTVGLQPGIKKSDGKNAFTGAYASGYGWTFEVSTLVDLTPPKVLYVIPQNNATEPMNVTVEMTFNEAMDPIASTGVFKSTKQPKFTNISILQANGQNVEGTFKIANGYRTVGFTSFKACAEDPCGNTIYCLPGDSDLDVVARAATLDNANPPQAQLIGISYDGLTDASGNSLDGNGDGTACGSATDTVACPNNLVNDNYEWGFKTTNEIDDTVPQIVTASPGVNAQNIDQNAPMEIQFNTLLMATTVVSSHASLWPDPLYEMWFVPGKTDDLLAKKSTVSIGHPAFISNAEGGHDYYPVLTHGLKSAYQICMYPATQAGSACNGVDSKLPYCCNGVPSAQACKTQSLPPGTLPGNVKPK